jgi:cyanophycinase
MALLHANVQVAPEPCAGGLDFVELRQGLGLAPFTLETQATQRGSLSRLLLAVGEGMAPAGWALDEGCMLELDDRTLQVHGPNNAWRVRRVADRTTEVHVFRAGTVLAREDW